MKGLAEALGKHVAAEYYKYVEEIRSEKRREYQMNSLTKDLRVVTRGFYKGRTVRLMGPDERIPGFVKCALPLQKKNKDGSYTDTDESTEIKVSEGQLAEC